MLDEIKKREILAILSVGCPRSTATRYVGCAPNTLLNTAARDPRFAEQLRHTEYRAEVEYLRAIQEATRQPGQWRAAAWVLERKNPQAYVRRSALVFTVAEVEQLLRQVAEWVFASLPETVPRQKVLKQLDRLLVELCGPDMPRRNCDEPETLDAQ